MNSSKTMEDVQQLIDDRSRVYSITTSEIHDEDSNSMQFLRKRSFEGRGLMTVIGSTLIATMVLLTFLYIQVFYTRSYFMEDDSYNTNLSSSELSQIDVSSTWETSFDLPEGIFLLEIHPSTFDFTSDCPKSNNFALVLHLETPISVFENWLRKCGSQVAYFRMNDGDPTIDDVDKIIKFVPKAQYIPIKAKLHVAKADNILSDPNFQSSVEFEGNIVNSLSISGYLTFSMLKSVLEIAPFVEELTIEGSEVCSSLVRQVRLSPESCQVSWSELRKLKIQFPESCVKTLDFISMCWEMKRIERLEIVESQINDINVKYIEDIIDRYRITNVKFEKNICAESTLQTHPYICI